MPSNPLEEILHPHTIAVVGASQGSGRGTNFIKALLSLGFDGEIYPVNPKYFEILGLRTYPSLKEIPGPVDYVICAIPANGVLNMLDDCLQKSVKVVHIFTGRFSETGRAEDAELEQEILKAARKSRIRLIGPNCMGVYYPGQGIGWSNEFSKESGIVGFASQSSYAAHDFILQSLGRGIRFSKVIGYGNALDFNESDFLEYLCQDTETRIILIYVEGVKDGKRFFASLRKATSTKPVVIVKGGRGEAGARAAASHTASLAGSVKVWKAALAQAGAIYAESMEELMDLAVSFYFLHPFIGRRVGITGTGGGPSVLAADQCEEEGLEVVPLPSEIRDELKNNGIPIWDWIGNPVDMSMTGGIVSAGDMLDMMSRNKNFDLLIALMGLPHYLGNQEGFTADKYLGRYKIESRNLRPLLAVVPDKNLDINNCEEPGSKLLSEIRTKLIAASIPFYPTMVRAARAAKKLTDYYTRIGLAD